MIDDTLEQRVQGIIQKLDTLQLSQEYGQLLKDLYGKVEAMEGEITKLKLIPIPSKEFKPGRLGVVLSRLSYDSSHFNGLEIAVSNGEQKYYGTTKCIYGKSFYVGSKKEDGRYTDPPHGYCEFSELPGGTYSIEVNFLGIEYGLNVTIDGDTFAELRLNQSNLKKNEDEKLSAAPAEKTPASTSSTLLPEKPVVSYHSNLLPKRVLSDKRVLFAVLFTTALMGAVTYALIESCARNTITGTMYLAPEQTNP